MKTRASALLIFLTGIFISTALAQQPLPALVSSGKTTQLIVDGKPFLTLGGELGNSTASTRQSMQPVWTKLKAMYLNTVLVPVFWELLEAEEGKYDFSLLRDLITNANLHQLKIIFLWFGSWKNSMSSHAPAWVKTSPGKYPRAKDQTGRSQEILSSFSEPVLQADRMAFENLMRFIKEFDGSKRIVIMIQVENEIGMLPSARDYQALANEAFQKNVPAELLQYMQQHKEKLVPEFLQIWKMNGYKTSGNWEEVFGKGLQTNEIFMAWQYARFANQMAQAGKQIYPIPMFVNAALNRPNREPGNYPSAGPLPHLMDVWKAAGTSIDFLAPDFYNPDFKHWCDLYTRQGDPLLVPEHAFDPTVAAKALYAIAHYEALGFSPFSIESPEKPKEEPLGKVYQLIRELTPLIITHQGQEQMQGALASKADPETIIRLGKYEFSCKHEFTLGWSPDSKADEWPLASAMIIQTGNDEFYVAGTGIVITCRYAENKGLNVGLLKVEEGHLEGAKWIVWRHLNGDQTHQGRHIRIPIGQFATQRVKLYTYP